MKTMKKAPWFSVGIVAVTLCSGCIIEDRVAGSELRNDGVRSDDDAGDDSNDDDTPSNEVSQACADYCEAAMANCQDEFQVYTSQAICESLCSNLPLGDRDEPAGNTIACRAEQARLAGTTGEPEVHCPNAGPGGNKRGSNVGCGTDCEAYCLLHPLLCDIDGEFPLEQDECLRQCAGLREKATFDVERDHHDQDSLECRLVHLTSAAEAPLEHCWHASLAPREGTPCDDLEGAEVPCDVYCDLVMVACTEEFQVYEDRDQCLSVCAVLPPGGAGDKTGNTVACRRYHSYNSLAAPSAHCAHAAPDGDGHCGTENCTAYCLIAEAACPEFSEEFPSTGDAGSLGSCMEQCMELEGANVDTSTYSLDTPPSGNNVGCRTLHAIRALSDADECSAAFGGGACR